MDKNKEYIKKILIEGSSAEKRELFSFDEMSPRKRVVKKFKLFAKTNYPRYFKTVDAPFHDELIEAMVRSYFGENKLRSGFRGCAKTSLKKLFDVFVLLNDRSGFRKYMKVLSKDIKNSRQIATDIYNLMVEVEGIYGNPFEKEGKIKREETMGSFTLANGRKYSSGTVGQTQRGHVQDAFRPDWIWFEDVEDRDSISSVAITTSTINRCEEAIDGLSVDGSYYITGNYISDQGVIQNFINKSSVDFVNIPLLKDEKDDSSATWPELYTPEKVAILRKDSKDFYGEYQGDPQKSFNKFFDLERIKSDLKKCTDPKRESAGVRYWAKYLPHHRYGMGSDHSEGVGLDANAMCLFDFTTGELVASYANNEIAPDLATHEFARVGAEFGNCIYAPEVNNKCGGTAISKLKEIEYPNIYSFEDETKINSKTTKLGWETNRKTKYNMFFDFRKDYNDGLIKIRDKNLLAEMKAYSNNDLNDEKVGILTRHFDLLTSATIAWQMKKKAAVMTSNYKKGYESYING